MQNHTPIRLESPRPTLQQSPRMSVPDVPSPIDLRQMTDAREWADEAMVKRPWRTEFFAEFAEQLAAGSALRVLELGCGPAASPSTCSMRSRTSRTRRSSSRRPCMNLQRSESARRAPASASSRRASAPPHEEPARSSPTRSRKPARRRRRRLAASSPRRSADRSSRTGCRDGHGGESAQTPRGISTCVSSFSSTVQMAGGWQFTDRYMDLLRIVTLR